MEQDFSFGHWLKNARQQARWTQTELARRMGYEVSLIRKIEAGRRLPSAEFQQRLTELLGIALPDPAVLTQAHILLPLDNLPAPAPLFAGSYLPLRANPLFTGRIDLLLQLAYAFNSYPTPQKTICLGQKVAATGLGGIGKTQLAVEFAHRYGRFFPGGVFWLNFADSNGIPGEVARCGRAAHLNLSQDFDQLSQEQQVALVQRAWQENIPRLLIFDNCEEETLVEKWRPTTGGCHVLITSRCQDWDLSLGVIQLMLEVLPRLESVRFLRHFLPTLSDSDADALAEAMGDLPLALHLAGNYLAQGEETPQSYLQHLQKQSRLQHPSLQTGRLSPTQHENNLAHTFALSLCRLDTLETQDQLALALLRRAVCFAPGQPIPLNLLAESLPDPLSLDEALTRLLKLGLVTLGENQTLRVHQLIAEFVQNWRGESEAPEGQEQALNAVAQTLIHETEKCNETRSLYPARDWQVHLRYVTENFLNRAEKETVLLCQTLGWHLFWCSDYQEATGYLEKALAIQHLNLLPNEPDIAITLDHLGRAWQSLSQYEKARSFLEEALILRQKAFGINHILVAESHNSLGLIYQVLNDNIMARKNFEDAIIIRKHLLGSSHPDTGFSYFCLALQCMNDGDYSEALDWANQALDISLAVYGEYQPDTVRIINGIGVIYQSMGSPGEARHFFAQAFDIRKKLLGVEHNDTLTTLANLSNVLRDLGNYSEARNLIEEGLAIRMKKFGLVHFSTAQSLHQLGYYFMETGNYKKALPLLEQVLSLFSSLLSSSNVEVAYPLISLGIVHHRLGHFNQAEDFFQKALHLRLVNLKENHLQTALTLTYLGDLYTDLEKFPEAIDYLNRAYQSLKEAKFPSPRYLSHNLHAQGRLFEVTGNVPQACHFYAGAYKLRHQYLGDEHPNTKQSLEALERLN
ncbi:MAG: helix-turn-helix transcriptional regulator [Anaerolineales bacterium]|nr:helix-turn-helix transcriptional regulator [Anaerolineales bacterium]